MWNFILKFAKILDKEGFFSLKHKQKGEYVKILFSFLKNNLVPE